MNLNSSTLILLFFFAIVSAQAHGEAQLFFIHTDHLGTPAVMTDINQNVVWERQQTPFGETVSQTDTSIQPQRFPGQIEDRETGYYYNYFRDYDPTIGRYLQSDPIGLRGGLNTYGYVYQNPLKYIDPYGLESDALNPTEALVGLGMIAAALAGNQEARDLFSELGDRFVDWCGGQDNNQYSRPPGFWPGDAGAAEWGRRNGVGAKEGKDRFHKGVKQRDPMSKPKDNYSTNPDTGDVIDPEGEYVGNLNDDYN